MSREYPQSWSPLSQFACGSGVWSMQQLWSTSSVSTYWLDTLKALNFFQVNCIFFSDLFLLSVLELPGVSGRWPSVILGAFLSWSSTTFLTWVSFNFSPSRCSLPLILDPGIADLLSSIKDGYTSLQKPIISMESQRLCHIKQKLFFFKSMHLFSLHEPSPFFF